MTTYIVNVTLDDEFWLVHVEGIGMTQAKTRDEVEAMARDLIEVMTGGLEFEMTIRG